MSHTFCSICAQLADDQSAYQKYGKPEDDTSLHAAFGKLVLVRDFRF